MGFIWFSAQTVIISLYSINHLFFVMEVQCVSSDVRTEFLNTVFFNEIWVSEG
jgi:hypothetical protein